ncbi:MAG: helix-turn-helix transcriptional regulator [Desulfovermiculus sp.]|nr:helix-turn-helix transcriptional regulator [Desulfovermiculus sp.]
MAETVQDLSLREMLQQAGLTQKQIAQKANVSPAAVSLIVSGKSKSKRIEDIIKKEAAKAMEQKQE